MDNQGDAVPVASGQRQASEEIEFHKGEDAYGDQHFHRMAMQAETLRHTRAMNDVAEARARQDLFTDQQSKLHHMSEDDRTDLEYFGNAPDSTAAKISDVGSSLNQVGIQNVAQKLAEALIPAIVAAVSEGAKAAATGVEG